jgi:hypothetical protein
VTGGYAWAEEQPLDLDGIRAAFRCLGYAERPTAAPVAAVVLDRPADAAAPLDDSRCVTCGWYGVPDHVVVVPTTREGDWLTAAKIALHQLMHLTGQPFLELGPMSGREAAYAQALASADEDADQLRAYDELAARIYADRRMPAATRLLALTMAWVQHRDQGGLDPRRYWQHVGELTGGGPRALEILAQGGRAPIRAAQLGLGARRLPSFVAAPAPAVSHRRQRGNLRPPPGRRRYSGPDRAGM